MEEAILTVKSRLRLDANAADNLSQAHFNSLQENTQKIQNDFNEVKDHFEKDFDEALLNLHETKTQSLSSSSLGGHLADGLEEMRLNPSLVMPESTSFTPRHKEEVQKFNNKLGSSCLRELAKEKNGTNSFYAAKACVLAAQNGNESLADQTLTLAQKIRYIDNGKLHPNSLTENEKDFSQDISSYFSKKDETNLLTQKIEVLQKSSDKSLDWKAQAKQTIEASKILDEAAEKAYLGLDLKVAIEIQKTSWALLDFTLSFLPFVGVTKDLVVGTTGYTFDGFNLVKISEEERTLLLASCSLSGAFAVGIFSPKALVYLEKLSVSSRGFFKAIQETSKIISLSYKLGIRSYEGFKAYKKVLPFINNLPENLRPVRFYTGRGDKYAIIGRTMGEGEIKGVRDVAEELRKSNAHVEIFDEKIITQDAEYDFIKKTANKTKWLSDDEVRETLQFKENMAWIQKLKEEGYHIIDIGNPYGKGSSIWYDTETELIWGK